MSATVKLDPQEARKDLTSRECSKLLGSLIGGLIGLAGIGGMAPRKAVRDALVWWAEHFDEAFPEN